MEKIIERNAAYVKSWIEAIREDKNIIFSASTQADKAVEYLDSLQ